MKVLCIRFFCVILQRNGDIIKTIKQMKQRILFLFTAVLMPLAMAAQIPAVTLKDLSGKTVRTDTLSNGGKPMIIDFLRPILDASSPIGIYETMAIAIATVRQRLA